MYPSRPQARTQTCPQKQLGPEAPPGTGAKQQGPPPARSLWCTRVLMGPDSDMLMSELRPGKGSEMLFFLSLFTISIFYSP